MLCCCEVTPTLLNVSTKDNLLLHLSGLLSCMPSATLLKTLSKHFIVSMQRTAFMIPKTSVWFINAPNGLELIFINYKGCAFPSPNSEVCTIFNGGKVRAG